MKKRRAKKEARAFIERVLRENENNLSKKQKKQVCNAWARMSVRQPFNLPEGIEFTDILD